MEDGNVAIRHRHIFLPVNLFEYQFVGLDEGPRESLRTGRFHHQNSVSAPLDNLFRIHLDGIGQALIGNKSEPFHARRQISGRVRGHRDRGRPRVDAASS